MIFRNKKIVQEKAWQDMLTHTQKRQVFSCPKNNPIILTFSSNYGIFCLKFRVMPVKAMW